MNCSPRLYVDMYVHNLKKISTISGHVLENMDANFQILESIPLLWTSLKNVDVNDCGHTVDKD